MCGIVTVMSNEGVKFNKDRAKFFREGILVDTLRGAHSTGVFAASEDKDNTVWFKKPVPGYDFIHLPNFSRLITNFDQVKFAIAHNRHATKGSINVHNSHPFNHGSVTGVHNGSLWTYKYLASGENFDTDSEHVIHSIANRGVQETVSELDGAFVLVWHDANDHTLHYIRNDERPFHLAYIKGQDTVVGASEKLMLKMLCARSELEIEKLYQLKVGREYIFKLDNLKNPEEVDRRLYKPPARQTNFLPGVQQQTPANSTIAGAERETRRAAVLLTQYGLKIGDRLDFWVGNWAPYTNSKNNLYGQLTGCWAKSPYLNIIVNGIERDRYDAMDNWYYSGEIVAASIGEGNVLTIVLGSTSLQEIEDEEGLDAPPKESGSTHGTFIEDDIPFGQDDALAVVDRILHETDDDDVPAWPKKYYKQGMKLKAAEALTLLKPGCTMCGKKLRLSQFSNLTWIEDDPVCPKCAASFV